MVAIVVIAAVIGALNGAIGGRKEIYDWARPIGWVAFALDSSWGLVGTALAVLVHAFNTTVASDHTYLAQYAIRQNRHAYRGGFAVQRRYAFTAGNVMSNLRDRSGSDLLDHETLHVWQSRSFGPLFQITYVVWLLAGGVVALVLAPFARQPFMQTVLDIAYIDNPWETWAYRAGGSADGGRLSWVARRE